ncbi:uncharacterized protein LOC119665730 [Teleopsis dalmanni]|uniref:uncharacterized protein LOC119665730 n=1 Tax=Teleopsis dalmanni TaxID=139649 RepID=UPI0018CC900C|nr:uncharacterized protein LOC119665730 [Teleopsis dalmanni]
MQNYLEEEYIANFTAGFEERKSKDEVENSRGHRFIHLCCDNGLVIANGMTKGDEEGEITFCSGVGMSVNDICAVSLEILEFIDKFEVGNTHWSDHFPIVLTLRLTDIETVRKNTNLLPKLKWNKQQVTAYKQRISETLLNVKQNKDLLTLTDITYVIKSAHKETQIREHSFEKKQNWFNWRCHKARQETFKSLEKFRQVSSSQNKEIYLKDNKHYKVICAEAKQRYYQQLDAKIQNVKTNKDWWNIAREINGNTSSTITMEAEMLKLYFSNVLNPSQTSLDIQYAHGYMEVYDLDKTITLREVKEFIERTKNYKAPGEDRIPYEFIKYAPDDLLSEITITCNDMFNSGIVDESFVKSIIYPIHKKGDVGLPCNYRGVSFMNCIAKIMMGVVTDRLTNWTENFKAAFDKVSRKALIYKLHAAGVSTKMVHFIENVYSNTKCAVWTGKDLSNEFSAVSGVKQGCILSPHLFVLYLNDLHDFLGGSIQIEELNIRTLMYADDIVILADDITTLQKMIYKLESYCHSWNLEINLSKSAIMVFRKGGRLANKEKWYLGGEEIRIVNEYCYLGVTLTPTMNFRKHVERRTIAAKNSINLTWNNFLSRNGIPIKAKWNLFLAISRAIQSYGAQVWGCTLFEEVVKLQLYFLKKILRMPQFTPTYILITMYIYGTERLPNQLTKKLLNLNLSWVQVLNELGNICGINWNQQTASRNLWKANNELLLTFLKADLREKYISKSQQTNRIYKDLTPSLGKEYIADITHIKNITWILKARSSMIELNGNRFDIYTSRSALCSMCNLDETEDIVHFLGRCPILQEFRLACFADKVRVGEHTRRFNAPSINEVAVVIVGEQFEKRDIKIIREDKTWQTIEDTHRSYDALQYPLIFWEGEDGYQINIKQRNPLTGV